MRVFSRVCVSADLIFTDVKREIIAQEGRSRDEKMLPDRRAAEERGKVVPDLSIE
jgi:hypothetical protein